MSQLILSQLSHHSQEDECDVDEPELPDTPELDVSPAPGSFEFPSLWGTLIAVDSDMDHQELTESEYVFGRDHYSVDVVLKHSSVDVINFSKKHFTVGFNGANREAYIIDNSTNGTFVGSERLPRDVQHNLLHLSRISVISEKNKVFIFLKESNYNEEIKSVLSVSILDKYFICDTIGKGSFGTVMLCIKKDNKFVLAMKEIKSSLKEEHKKYFATEVNNLKVLSHPNIVALYETVSLNSNIYMFLEYIPDGDLTGKLDICKKLGEQTCKCIIYQISLALQYLHSFKIVHRDLKPANILLKSSRHLSDDNLIIKVCDFGLSKNIDAESSLKSKVGTPMFVAPEVLYSNRYDEKVDVWSLGIILYLCLSGSYPFPSDDQFPGGRFFEALTSGINLRTHGWLSASAQVKNLLLRTIVFNPMNRFNVKDIVMHDWIKRDQQMVTALDNTLRQEMSDSEKRLTSISSNPLTPNKKDGSSCTLVGYNLCGN